MGGLNFGFGQSTTKNKSWIDDKTRGAQWAEYDGSRGIPETYRATSPEQIGAMMSPFIDGVIDPSLKVLDKFRQMSVNRVGDQAGQAGAFGGSRHGVAESLTNSEFGDKAAVLSAQLYNQGYGQARGAAQEENRMGHQYPLARQGLINATLAGVEPIRYSTGKQTDMSAK